MQVFFFSILLLLSPAQASPTYSQQPWMWCKKFCKPQKCISWRYRIISSPPYPTLLLLRPFTDISLQNRILPSHQMSYQTFLLTFFLCSFGILSELIQSTCSYQFILYYCINSVISEICRTKGKDASLITSQTQLWSSPSCDTPCFDWGGGSARVTEG